MIHTHSLPPKFRQEAIIIDLVGCGGNGSQMLTGLARLDKCLRSLGHPFGLQVRVVDPDHVTEANLGRQLFSRADLGLPKAAVLVNRINLFFGLQWEACCHKYEGIRKTQAGLVIGCVDTAAARRSIHAAVRAKWDCYWLDLGNEEQTGQVVLGRWVKTADSERNIQMQRRMEGEDAEAGPTDAEARIARLPLVTELFPHLLDKSRAESSTPSCSLAEALGKQDLFINQGVATFALNLLWRLLRDGSITHHGYFVNMEAGRVTPMPIDPAAWQRLAAAKVRRPRLAKKGKAKKPSPKKRGTRAAN